MQTLFLAVLLFAAAPAAFAQDCSPKDVKPGELPPGVTVAGGTFNENGSIVTSQRRTQIIREFCAKKAALAAAGGAEEARARDVEARRLLTDLGAARGTLELGQAAPRIEPLLERWKETEQHLPRLKPELAEALRSAHARLLATYGAGRVSHWQGGGKPTPTDSAIMASLPAESADRGVLTQRRYLDAAEAQHKLNLKRVEEAASRRAIAAVGRPDDQARTAPPAEPRGDGNDTCDAVRNARGIGSDSVARQRCTAMGAYK